MTILDLPFEMRWVILSNVTDPFDIIEISQSNSILRNTLKQSVTKLTTDRDYLMLDQNWLKDYPGLANVDDSIVFQLNNMTELQIPNNLKKINIYLNYDLDNNQNNLLNIIESIISKIHENILDYTIRFTIVGSFDQGYSSWIILDRGYYKLDGFQRDDESMIIKYLSTLAFKKYYYIGNLVSYVPQPAYYPNKRFRDFITDISHELDINLFDYLFTYIQYGYINQNLIPKLVTSYVRIKKLKLSESTKRILAANWDHLLLKYTSELSRIKSPYYFKMFKSINEFEAFPTRYISKYIHFYLIYPPINLLCLTEYENISNFLDSLYY